MRAETKRPTSAAWISPGRPLNVEITLMHERRDDIKALRGRSRAHSLEALREHLELVRLGKADPLERVRSLAVDGVAAAVSAVVSKLTMSYGPNTALVVCETCPLEWDWDLVPINWTAQLGERRNPFDKGVWLIEDSGSIRPLLPGRDQDERAALGLRAEHPSAPERLRRGSL